MVAQTTLADLLQRSAKEFPNRCAVREPNGREISYADFATLTDRLRDRLYHIGVRPGDRVGLRLHKTIDSVATLFGILKTGASYVPVDAESPAPRGAYILDNCQVKVVVTEKRLEEEMNSALQALGASPHFLSLDTKRLEWPLEGLLNELDQSQPAPEATEVTIDSTKPAYILYTSGSTGKPKGVVLTHINALSFIDWCSSTFQPTPEDRFSSHAPFHFDLSILDIYVPLKHGATLVLIGEALGKDPMRLAAAISEEMISVWYSTPSILSLLANYGKLQNYDFSALHTVFFAGEVFPIPQYLTLRKYWNKPRFFNLYGPTETNVCTWFQVPSDEASVAAMSSFPIGRICEPNLGMVVDEENRPLQPGDEGELLVHGPNVMGGYWNLPEQNSKAFYVDDQGRQWYRTGDIVREVGDGVYLYLSRRDRMVKRRGYRVELGEIEVALTKHESLREAAVVAVPDETSGVKVCAYVSCKESVTVSIIALKSHCTKNLPPYMAPDVFTIVEKLPRTTTDKIDYQTLKSQASKN